MPTSNFWDQGGGTPAPPIAPLPPAPVAPPPPPAPVGDPNVDNRNRPGGLPGTNQANNYSDPNWIMAELTRRGLNTDLAGNPTFKSISDFSNARLNQSQGSPSGGTNAILDDLYKRLGNVSFDQPVDILTQFLGMQNGQYSSPGSGGGSPVFVGGSNGHGGTTGAGGSGGGMPPDTVGNQNSFFAQKVKEFFDPSRLDPANDPTMAPYLEALRQAMGEQNAQNMASTSRQAEGLGGSARSSLANALLRRTADSANTNYGNQAAAALMGARSEALGAQQNLLGLVNQRDLGAMSDATSRYGIDASSAASGAASQAQQDIARRGQDLDAITALMGYQQGGLGMLNNIGQFNGTQQNQAMANLGSLLGMQQSADQFGQTQAANAGNWMGQNYWTGQQMDMQKQAEEYARRQAEQEAAFGREQWDWTRGWQDQFNENRLLQDYLDGLVKIGGMGGTSTGGGSTTTPGAGISDWGAFLQGALGGGMAGAGMFKGNQ